VTTGTLNPRLREIIGDFGTVPGNERLQLLLEFPEELPALPARYAGHRNLLERVPECQTPLFLAVEVDDGGTVHLFSMPRRSLRPPAASPASSTRPLMGSMPMMSWPHRASSPASWGSTTW